MIPITTLALDFVRRFRSGYPTAQYLSMEVMHGEKGDISTNCHYAKRPGHDEREGIVLTLPQPYEDGFRSVFHDACMLTLTCPHCKVDHDSQVSL